MSTPQGILEGVVPPMTAKDATRALRLQYHQRVQRDSFGRDKLPLTWVFVEEFRLGTGWGRNNEQRLDGWAMHLTGQLERLAFEVKVSRSDLLAELKNPRKRARALLVSNQFYFVTPPGLMSVDELPLEAGLIEVKHHDTEHPYLDFVEQAPWRDVPPPTWRFVASLLRRAMEDER